MGPPPYMRSVVDRNVVIRRIPVFLLRHSRVVAHSGETSVYPDESRTRRDEQRRKYSTMDKRAKDKLVRSPRENGGG